MSQLNIKKWIKSPGVSWQDFGEGSIVLNPNRQKVHELNPTASHIWLELTQGSNFSETLKSLTNSFDVSEDQARKDIEKFLKDATEWELLQEG